MMFFKDAIPFFDFFEFLIFAFLLQFFVFFSIIEGNMAFLKPLLRCAADAKYFFCEDKIYVVS